MSKVYVLMELSTTASYYANPLIIGVVSNEEVARKFRFSGPQDTDRWSNETELDDPELLNRIAKESEKDNES